MGSRVVWLAIGGLLLLIALGNLALVGVMNRLKPERGPLTLHVPESPEGAAPYLATPPEVAEAMLRLAAVQAGETVYDLGCGDARILVMAAQKFSARGVGVELDGHVFALARQNVRRHRLEDRVTLLRGDIFQADLRGADVVALYLLPEAQVRLRPLLERQLRPGARVVTHDFGISGWQAARTEKLPRGDGTSHTIHLYRR